MTLSILYRGPLESCNYGCTYCPFAKKVDTREELATDRAALERFVAWALARTQDDLGVLITPWGEGLVRRHYQDALVRLSHARHVTRAVIQTNLSCDVGWAERADPSRLALWATYHPEWTTLDAFVAKVVRLRAMGIRVSCGAVGFEALREPIERLRAALPEDVYLWVNAAKSSRSYDEDAIAAFERVDPLFRTNTVRHPSLGRACRAGESVVTVDGAGDVRRCHFVDEVIGNLYDGTFDAALRPRPCPNATCGCHIGYVHLEHLDLYRTFAGGILERVPAEPVWRRRLPVA